MPQKEITPQELRDNLNLIDHNIRHQRYGPLEAWFCENCRRTTYYPRNAPPPQCPHCSTAGYVTRMKRRYGGLTLITKGE